MNTLNDRLEKITLQPDAQLPSLAVVVVQENEPVYQGVFGNRYIDNQHPENNLPVNLDTKFRIASISKSVATLGAMQLVEQGKLDLDRDISDYLGFTMRNPHHPDTVITTRLLLSHTSSIDDGTVYSIPVPYTMRDFFLPDGEFYRDGEHFLKQKPGTYFTYCNLNYGVLAAIMEQVSGERFDHYMAAHIFKPLGIDAAYNIHLLSDAGFANLAALYRKFDGERWHVDGTSWYPQVDEYRGVRPDTLIRIENPDLEDPKTFSTVRALDDYVLGSNGTLFSPQGGLRISAVDLARIMQVFMNGGIYAGVRLLQPESIEQMMTLHWQYDEALKNGDTSSGFMRAWGLSLQKTTASGGAGNGDKIEAGGQLQLWGHGGDAYGLLSGMWFDPQNKFGFVYIAGGAGASPEDHVGAYSTFVRWEEQIITAICETYG